MQDLIRSICSAWGVLFRSALVYYYPCSSRCTGGDEIDDIVIFRYRMKNISDIFFMRAYARIIGIQSLHQSQQSSLVFYARMMRASCAHMRKNGIQSLHQSHQSSLAHNRKLPTDHDGNMINILQVVS